MRTIFLLLLLPLSLRAQQQCPLRYMFQYYPPAQHNATESIRNDSTTSWLIAYSTADGFPSTISPSVGWTVDNADSFGVFIRTDSAVFVVFQHDGIDGTFVIDTTVTGPCYWHLVSVPVTPGEHNYSIMLYPICPTGPLRSTVFDVPVYFGAAYEWSAAPASVSYSGPKNSRVWHYYDELGREIDSNSRMARFRR